MRDRIASCFGIALFLATSAGALSAATTVDCTTTVPDKACVYSYHKGIKVLKISTVAIELAVAPAEEISKKHGIFSLSLFLKNTSSASWDLDRTALTAFFTDGSSANAAEPDGAIKKAADDDLRSIMFKSVAGGVIENAFGAQGVTAVEPDGTGGAVAYHDSVSGAHGTAAARGIVQAAEAAKEHALRRETINPSDTFSCSVYFERPKKDKSQNLSIAKVTLSVSDVTIVF